MKKLKIFGLFSFWFFLISTLAYTQKNNSLIFEYIILDSIDLQDEKLSVYRKNNPQDTSAETRKAAFQFLNENQELFRKYRNAGEFSRFSGNGTISAVRSTKRDKEKTVLNFVYYRDLWKFHTVCEFYGKIRILNKTPYLVCLRSTFRDYSIAIVKVEIDVNLGKHPAFLDTISLDHNPVPSPVYSEIDIKEYGFVDSLKTIAFDNSLLLRLYKKKLPRRNKSGQIENLMFNLKTKKWVEAIIRKDSLNADTTFNIPEYALSFGQIEKNKEVQKRIEKLCKQVLNIKCNILKMDAIKEGKNILFCVGYKKKCKSIFLEYDLKNSRWQKIEFEEAVINADKIKYYPKIK